MNLENANQINSLIRTITMNLDLKELKEFDNENYFECIKKKKELIKFYNSDNELIKIKVPNFITKSDLYSIAKRYKVFNRTNFILIHNNKILKNDESSIDDILSHNNIIIIIIENRYYPDNSLYEHIIQSEYLPKSIISIFLRGNINRSVFINQEATIKELIETIVSTTGIIYEEFFFFFNAKRLYIDDMRKIYESGITNNSRIF